MSVMLNFLLIMRAIPGSGKSTVAKFLQKNLHKVRIPCVIHSTDEKHMVNGKYEFDPGKAHYFHELNFLECKASMKTGVRVIIIDNTNKKTREFSHYIKEAHENNYLVGEIILMPDELEIHMNRNIHGVPMDALENMHDMFMRAPKPSKKSDFHYILMPNEVMPLENVPMKVFKDLVFLVTGEKT